MNRQPLPNTYLISLIHLDEKQKTPLYGQIYYALRQAILMGKLRSGVKLPSSRDLADLLQVSRTTVVNAYDQLLAEGYVDSQVGAGTYVADLLPEAFIQSRPLRQQVPITAAKRPLSTFGQAASKRGKRYNLSRVNQLKQQRAFQVGLPDLNEFPFSVWSRLATHHLRFTPTPLYQIYTSLAGHPPLREAISDYLQTARAVNCTPEQIVIVSGAQQALFLAAQVLLNADDTFWVEDPGYLSAIGALNSTGASTIPVPVDRDGLIVSQGMQLSPNARLACVAPSRQYPLGYRLSLKRRLALLAWAAENSAWILEDDYDSEFRYEGAPLASLQGLDSQQRVIYIGTFSKMLFPSLRLGYLVVPPDLIDAFLYARMIVDQYMPILDQLILTDFMTHGHFMRHLRRMRKLYGERCQALQAALVKHCAKWVDIGDASAGMHLVAWLKDGLDDKQVAAEAAKRGLSMRALSSFYLVNSPPRGGLVLGFTTVTPERIETAVIKLAQVLADAEKQLS